MDENKIKEAISESFIRLVLAHDGFNVSKGDSDYGVDLAATPVEKIILPNGDITFNDSGLSLNMQLKSTTHKGVNFKKEFVEYYLRNKNYRDLKRKVDAPYGKLILIVFILPDNKDLWMDVFEDNVLLRKHCFWYIPSDSVIPANILTKGKDSKVKIHIPIENHILKNFRLIYNSIYGL